MSKLTGYRTIAVNALLFLAGLVGLHVSPETVQNHVNIVIGVFTAANVFMRILTNGPVGRLVPQLGRLVAVEDRLAALLAQLPMPAFPKVTLTPITLAAEQPAPSTPAPAAGQDDVAALLPIYAAKIATAVNETLSETSKAN